MKWWPVCCCCCRCWLPGYTERTTNDGNEQSSTENDNYSATHNHIEFKTCLMLHLPCATSLHAISKSFHRIWGFHFCFPFYFFYFSVHFIQLYYCHVSTPRWLHICYTDYTDDDYSVSVCLCIFLLEKPTNQTPSYMNFNRKGKPINGLLSQNWNENVSHRTTQHQTVDIGGNSSSSSSRS